MRTPEVLIIDDDAQFAQDLAAALTPDFSCRIASSGEEGLGWLEAGEPDAVVLDLIFESGRGGLETLDRIRATDAAIPVILVTGHPSPETEAEALRRGALYYVRKSLGRTEILAKLRKCIEVGEAVRQRNQLRHECREAHGVFLSSSASMRQLGAELDLVARAASSTVLITGESGTGKSLIAKEIHRRSPRADKAFLRLNTATLSPELADSLLFGHRKGSFTTAISDRQGYFEAARGGILFLDEIGSLTLEVQARLLGALEEREILPVGANQPIRIDVRVIAATHHNLDALVREGNFREDLLGRLSVLRIHVPPLRDHLEDIPELARYFLGRCAAENCLSRVVLTDEAMRRLRTHPWTRGNVRELRNTIERAVVLHGHEGILDPATIDLPAGAAEAPPTWDYETEKGRAVVAFQRQFFQRAFGAVSGSLNRPHPEDWARVAELTQISVRNLRRVVAEIHRDDPGRAIEESGAAD